MASRNRSLAIDIVRGFAVVAMILTHANDSWLLHEPQNRWLAVVMWGVGGFAAPGFCMLMAVSATMNPPKVGFTLRGANLLAAGYLLNVASWLVEFWWTARPVMASCITIGAILMFWATQERGRLAGLVVGVALFALGARALPDGTARSMLLRVDVLHALGISLWAAGLAVRFLPPMSWLPAIVALGGAIATPHIVGVVQSFAPTWIADYVAARSDHDGYALFRLFPFASYALLAVSGTRAMLALQRDPKDPVARRLAAFLILATAPVNLVPEGNYHALHSLVFFGLLVSAGLVAAELVGRAGILQLLGRHSLFAYVFHVQIVYSSLSWRLRHNLNPLAWFIATGLLLAATIYVAKKLEAHDQGKKARLKAVPLAPVAVQASQAS